MAYHVTPNHARAVALRIAGDVRGRRGLGDEWDEIDEDVQDEIIASWASIVAGTLAECHPLPAEDAPNAQ